MLGGEKMEEYDKSMEYISQTQTLVGQKKRELVDTETGETILVDQITKRTYGTKNFFIHHSAPSMRYPTFRTVSIFSPYFPIL